MARATRGGMVKRVARVNRDASTLGDHVSKADLLEVAWSLASLCNGADSCDDDDATLRRLHEELNAFRQGRGATPFPPIAGMVKKWNEQRAEVAAKVARRNS